MRVLMLGVLLALAAIGAASAADDIVGYRSGTNTWVLGADIDDMSLKGFTQQYVDPEDDDALVYYDESRTIQYGGKNVTAAVCLVFRASELTGIAIGVPTKQRSFKSLREYYIDRMKGVPFHGDSDYPSWSDDDGDDLSLEQYVSAEGQVTHTIVMYARQLGFFGPDRGDVPMWWSNILGY